MRTTKQKEFMTVNEVAELMRVKPLTIYRMLSNDKLPATKFGKSWRIFRQQLYEQLKLNP